MTENSVPQDSPTAAAIGATGRDTSHFRRIIAARRNVAQAEDDLRKAVQAARDAGRSWALIGSALGTTRQAAFQRFGRRP